MGSFGLLFDDFRPFTEDFVRFWPISDKSFKRQKTYFSKTFNFLRPPPPQQGPCSHRPEPRQAGTVPAAAAEAVDGYGALAVAAAAAAVAAKIEKKIGGASGRTVSESIRRPFRIGFDVHFGSNLYISNSI